MTTRYDVAIIGAGPVGMALGLMLTRLARDPARIALFGRRAAVIPDNGHDPRTLALNEGSRLSLLALNAWPAHAAPIRTIHVSQSGRLGRTLIRHDDFNVPALGHVAHYASLTDALHARVHASGLTWQDAIAVSDIQQDHHGDASYPMVLKRSDDTIRARLVILADGAGGADIVRDYNQHAVLTTARASRPRPAWAWERFRNEGPLAVLPHPAGDDLYAIVWCCRPETASALQAQDAASFSQALTDAFGDRLGTLSVDGARHVFPLSLRARRALVEGNMVAIGNAAQSLHPVAGQGLNLGLRDASQLAQAVAPWLADPTRDAALAPMLARYARSRLIDRSVTGLATDIMPRAFTTGFSPIEHACGAALLALDVSRTLRTPLARQLLYGSRG